MAQLEADLAVARDCIRDLTEINSLLRRTPSNPAPAGATENVERPPPPQVMALPESRHLNRNALDRNDR